MLGLLSLGLAAGAFSGMIGIGGGVIIVPALIYLFGFSQHLAQGTTMALLVPPIGILGAITYYRAGHVDIKVALLVGLGFIVGSFSGSLLAVRLPNFILSKVFGGVLILIGIKMLVWK